MVDKREAGRLKGVEGDGDRSSRQSGQLCPGALKFGQAGQRSVLGTEYLIQLLSQRVDGGNYKWGVHKFLGPRYQGTFA